MNNDTASHTPTPWTYSEDHGEPHVRTTSGLSVILLTNTSDKERAKADAKFAILACNSHASLKAEVERLRAGISSLLKNRPYCHHMAVSGIDEYQELAPVDDCGCSACASVRSALSLVSESTTQGS